MVTCTLVRVTLEAMILRDPVHGLISFEGAHERLLKTLLATNELQRLRRIKQLGLASMVFPGAEHSRFSHAIGAMHVMGLLLARVKECGASLRADERLDEETERDALAAALLHDVGHGPFSHTFEELFGATLSHETWTQQILLDDHTELHRALERLSRGMAARVASLLAGKHRLGYLCRALSGLLDVDRCDYLLRDSHMTGASYGHFDLAWLLRSLCFDYLPTHAHDPLLVIEGRRGLPSIEGFFLARHAMYRQDYHHRATRAAECLLKAIFERATDVAREKPDVLMLPRALRGAIHDQTISLSDYLELDDATLLYVIAEWKKGDDLVLKQLSEAFLRRQLPKVMHLGDDRLADDKALRIEQAARALAKSKGFDDRFAVWFDVSGDVPYEENEPASLNDAWVQTAPGSLTPLSELSFVLKSLHNRELVTKRLMCVEPLRDDIAKLIATT